MSIWAPERRATRAVFLREWRLSDPAPATRAVFLGEWRLSDPAPGTRAVFPCEWRLSDPAPAPCAEPDPVHRRSFQKKVAGQGRPSGSNA